MQPTMEGRLWDKLDKMDGLLVHEQRDAQIPFYVFIFIYDSLHV